ncbi:MAG: phosphatidate cytidylyltransferase [Planctomycetota bacterium]|nr:phosphatidate cytidylyltransferase [Planctomycetota bacterium]
MFKRLVLGPILIVALVGLIWLDDAIDRTPTPAALEWLFRQPTCPPGVIITVVMLPLAFMASRELARILREKGIMASKGITSLASISGLLTVALMPAELSAPLGATIVGTTATIVLFAALLKYSAHHNVQGTVAAAGGTLLAFVYLGLMFAFVLAVRRDHSAFVLLWMLVSIKACDIGAYFTGRAIGRHKLILWLSPGKTWEGLVGGVLTSAAVAAGGAVLLHRSGVANVGPWYIAAAGGLVFGLVGQAGDLIMSLFKRDAGRKDSGSSIPGFGGVLDVLDSPLLVAPVAFWYLHLLAQAPAAT